MLEYMRELNEGYGPVIVDCVVLSTLFAFIVEPCT